MLRNPIFLRGLTLALTAAAALGLTLGAAGTEDLSGGPVARDMEIATYRNIPYQADFLAVGDAVSFQLETEPERGQVELTETGFVYTPDADQTGSDIFTYTATDSQGRSSAPAKVRVQIEKPASGVVYADLEGEACAAAAQRLAEEGIFVGACLGGTYFFEPARSVSRSEFLAMTMAVTGAEAPAVTMTGFCDDAAIPTWAKAYASAALSDGLIYGSPSAEGMAFRGEEPISVAAAAAILDRALSVSDVDLETWYADREAVPSWAAQAVGNLESVQVMAVGSYGSDGLEEPITRAQAAQMLAAADTLLEGEQTGWLDWLL